MTRSPGAMPAPPTNSGSTLSKIAKSPASSWRTAPVSGLRRAQGEIRAEAVGVTVAGHSSELMAKAGVKLPIHSYALQAMVSEPMKPRLDIVLLHLGTGAYVSHSDKGELVFGGGLDRVLVLRPARQSADAGDRRLRPHRDVSRLRPIEAYAAMGLHRRRRPQIRRRSSDRRRSRGLFSIAAGEPGGSRRFPPAGRCSPTSSRPGPITRSAARSTSTAFGPAA